jgi:hypothetical protein
MDSQSMRLFVSIAIVVIASLPGGLRAQQPVLSEPKNGGRVEGTAYRNDEESIDLPVGASNTFEPVTVRASEQSPTAPGSTVPTLTATDDGLPKRQNSMWVGFGERSVDDMLQVRVNIVYLDDAKARPAPTSSVQNR